MDDKRYYACAVMKLEVAENVHFQTTYDSARKERALETIELWKTMGEVYVSWLQDAETNEISDHKVYC